MLSELKRVIVGSSKPILNYVTACITLFNSGESVIVVRARGRAINKAVEVVQLLKRRFMNNLVIASVKICDDVIQGRDGRSFSLPVLEMVLSKPDHVNATKTFLKTGDS